MTGIALREPSSIKPFSVKVALLFAWDGASERRFSAGVLFLGPIAVVLLLVALVSTARLFAISGDLPVFLSGLFGLASFVVLFPLWLGWPVSWLRLFLFDEPERPKPFKIGGAEFRFLLSSLFLHALGTLAVMPAAILGVVIVVVIQAFVPPEALRWLAPLVLSSVAISFYAYVIVRLSPSLALGLIRDRMLLTVSWPATKPIRAKMFQVWLIWAAAYLVMMMVGTFIIRLLGASVFSADLIGGVILLGGHVAMLVWALGIISYTTLYLLDVNPELGADPASYSAADAD
jgi:hypothetical protein